MIYGFLWPIRQVVYRLVYYEHTPKSNQRVSPPQILLVNQIQFDYKKP